jgi:hypothetical protein
MSKFPEFIKSSTDPVPEIARWNLGGGEGAVFAGNRGNSVVWTYPRSQQSESGINRFDEYVAVLEGCYTVTANGTSTAYGPDQQGGLEAYIHSGLRHSRQVIGGTRAIHVFGLPKSPTD